MTIKTVDDLTKNFSAQEKAHYDKQIGKGYRVRHNVQGNVDARYVKHSGRTYAEVTFEYDNSLNPESKLQRAAAIGAAVLSPAVYPTLKVIGVEEPAQQIFGVATGNRVTKEGLFEVKELDRGPDGNVKTITDDQKDKIEARWPGYGEKVGYPKSYRGAEELLKSGYMSGNNKTAQWMLDPKNPESGENRTKFLEDRATGHLYYFDKSRPGKLIFVPNGDHTKAKILDVFDAKTGAAIEDQARLNRFINDYCAVYSFVEDKKDEETDKLVELLHVRRKGIDLKDRLLTLENVKNNENLIDELLNRGLITESEKNTLETAVGILKDGKNKEWQNIFNGIAGRVNQDMKENFHLVTKENYKDTLNAKQIEEIETKHGDNWLEKGNVQEILNEALRGKVKEQMLSTVLDAKHGQVRFYASQDLNNPVKMTSMRTGVVVDLSDDLKKQINQNHDKDLTKNKKDLTGLEPKQRASDIKKEEESQPNPEDEDELSRQVNRMGKMADDFDAGLKKRPNENAEFDDLLGELKELNNPANSDMEEVD